MKRTLITMILITLLPMLLAAQQRVGLVMSGGGAKGLAHIGVIKALEEEHIPIDYVTGTSMGAIVGALYAMGYSPDDMIKAMKSSDFQRWYTGTMDREYMFYFKHGNSVPDMLSIHFDYKDSIHVVAPSPNIVSAAPMNLGFMEIFAGANAVCHSKFDSLMIPFRCVAADVYNKKQVVFSDGDLGDAVRASMTYPFFFKPIKKDGVQLYDGGLYNNFPQDVMKEDFNPDIIIGSVVSDNPPPPDEKDIMSQVENMIMNRSDYSLDEKDGILLDVNVKGVKLLDFQKIDHIVAAGYRHAKAHIDSIKQRIPQRQDSTLLAKRRKEFKERIPELRFNNVEVHGVTPKQEKSIANEFYRFGDTFSYDTCKKGYYSLLSGSNIQSVIPHAVYNETDSMYTLHLDATTTPPFTLKLGGNVATNISNQLYFGLHYRNLGSHSKEFILDGQLGKVYNNVQFAGKIDFLSKLPVSMKVLASYSTIDYYNMKYLFSKENSVALNHEREVFGKIKFILPFLNQRKAEFSIGIAEIKDEYMPRDVIDLNTPTFDKNKMLFYGTSIKFEGNTLDSKIFPTSGTYTSLISQFITGTETYTDVTDATTAELDQSWLQISYQRRDHFPIGKKLTLGTHLHLFYSTRRFSQTYQATVMQAGSFNPTMNSLFNYDPLFRANQFVAGGVTPIIKLNSILQVRPSFYVFVPYRKIIDNNGKATYSKERFNDFQYIGDITVAAKFSNISVSAFVNYYSSHKTSVDVGLTIGWFMFHERFIEQ
ncbi:MAG: patatin-like phospholipase family protein [Bacteroidaceae bacterium]|nr:patatin-like phospholipase family protein [Bacteroidaceae bacterium]